MTHQDQWTELSGDDRLLWFLRVIEGAGGTTDAGDNPHCALAVFCDDRKAGDDTYNLSEGLGFTITMHSGWGDGCATVSITEDGRAALAKAEAALADREQPGTSGASEPSPPRSISLSGEAVAWRPIETMPAGYRQPFAETNGRQYAVRSEPNSLGDLMQSSPATWGCVVQPTHWMPLPPAPSSQGGEGGA